jgi:hypothetical protein
VADFDCNGTPDLAVVNARESGTVSILLGHGDGTFDPPQAFSVGRLPVSVAAGDFNGDGLWDLAVANASPSLLIPGPVSILLGNGDGTFGPADNVPAGVSPQSVVVADFNGDEFSDLAVGNRRSHDFSVLLGRGDGTFQAAQHFGPGNDPIPLAVGDFNGDGLADLVAPHSGTNLISVLINTTR